MIETGAHLIGATIIGAGCAFLAVIIIGAIQDWIHERRKKRRQ